MTSNRDSLLVIIDGGGGLTVQCDEYVHSYEGWSNEAIAEQAAEDVKKLLAGEDPSDWDGHQPECMWDGEELPDHDIDVFSASEIDDIVSGKMVLDEDRPLGGYMGRALWQALRASAVRT